MTQDKSPYRTDPWLLASVLALAAFGVVMVYSSSAVFAAARHQDALHYLKRHVAYLVLGAGAMWVGARVDYSVWRRLCAPLLLATIVLLGVCLTSLATRAGGASRWLSLGGFTFQPSEMARFVLVLYLASALARRVEWSERGERPPPVRHGAPLSRPGTLALLGPLGVAGFLIGLVLLQPDLGTAVVLSAVTVLLLFVAGGPVTTLVIGVLAVAPIAWHKLIVDTPWRLRRLVAFLDPWSVRQDAGYQVAESLISVGSGGAAGLGLGDGHHKLFFLPEAHTDFILAIAGEELGLAGIAAVIACFALLLARSLLAARRARDAFGGTLAFGLACSILLGALVHVGVVLGLLPTKGLVLPFVSYGGSSLVTSLFSAGVLLNIASGRPEPAGLRVERGGRLGNLRTRPRTAPVPMPAPAGASAGAPAPAGASGGGGP